MSRGVTPAKVFLFESPGRSRLLPVGPLSRRDGRFVVPLSWLNAVKARYSRTLRSVQSQSDTVLGSVSELPVAVQRALANRLGTDWPQARGFSIPVGEKRTVGACAWRKESRRLEMCVYTENAFLLAVGHARRGAERITWSAV